MGDWSRSTNPAAASSMAAYGGGGVNHVGRVHIGPVTNPERQSADQLKRIADLLERLVKLLEDKK